MLASLTLNDQAGSPVTLHETSKRFLTRASGLAGISPPRDLVRARPQQHGAIDDTRYTDHSMIILEGECYSTISIEDAFAEFRTITAPMIATLEANTPALLKWTEGTSGLALQKLVKLASDVDPVLNAGEATIAYQAQFRAADPRAYAQALSTFNGAPLSTASGGVIWPAVWPWLFNPATGGLCPVTNAGNRRTPPIFRILGGCSNPVIIRQSTQTRMTLNGTILAGDYVELDVAKRTIKLNGSSNATSMLNAAQSDWSTMEIPPGAETFQLVASSFDSAAALTTIFRAAYA